MHVWTIDARLLQMLSQRWQISILQIVLASTLAATVHAVSLEAFLNFPNRNQLVACSNSSITTAAWVETISGQSNVMSAIGTNFDTLATVRLTDYRGDDGMVIEDLTLSDDCSRAYFTRLPSNLANPTHALKPPTATVFTVPVGLTAPPTALIEASWPETTPSPHPHWTPTLALTRTPILAQPLTLHSTQSQGSLRAVGVHPDEHADSIIIAGAPAVENLAAAAGGTSVTEVAIATLARTRDSTGLNVTSSRPQPLTRTEGAAALTP